MMILCIEASFCRNSNVATCDAFRPSLEILVFAHAVPSQVYRSLMDGRWMMMSRCSFAGKGATCSRQNASASDGSFSQERELAILSSTLARRRHREEKNTQWQFSMKAFQPLRISTVFGFVRGSAEQLKQGSVLRFPDTFFEKSGKRSAGFMAS
jgi:hypothetical protein